MKIITNRKIFYVLSLVLIIASIFVMVYFGFNVGIDFKGGTLTNVSYVSERPAQSEIDTAVTKLSLGEYSLRPSGQKDYTLRTRELSQDEQNKVLASLSLGSSFPISASQFNTVGPSVGNELTRKAYIAITIAVIAILLFITFAFRKVSEPLSSWKYGLAAVIGLIHDIIIPAGFFILFSHFYGGEVDLLFVTALLAILGYSVHDKIVVFDRVRENLRLSKEGRNKKSFEAVVGESVTQTIGRSINTSLTIFLVLVALFVLGSVSTKDFALVLIAGVIAGTYSSIFFASPLLVTLELLQSKK